MSRLLDSFPLASFHSQPEGQSGASRHLGFCGWEDSVGVFLNLSQQVGLAFSVYLSLVDVAGPGKHSRNPAPIC